MFADAHTTESIIVEPMGDMIDFSDTVANTGRSTSILDCTANYTSGMLAHPCVFLYYGGYWNGHFVNNILVLIFVVFRIELQRVSLTPNEITEFTA